LRNGTTDAICRIVNIISTSKVGIQIGSSEGTSDLPIERDDKVLNSSPSKINDLRDDQRSSRPRRASDRDCGPSHSQYPRTSDDQRTDPHMPLR